MLVRKSVSDMEIKGYVTTGVGKGSIFINMKQYRTQFNDKLGFEPEYGTLNIEVNPEVISKVMDLPHFEIQGFEMAGQSFGKVKCWPSIFEGDYIAVIIPYKNHSANVIEVIAPYNLRARWKLRDGGEILINVLEA